MLENSKAENTRLKVELKALDSLLESAKFQLASTAVKVLNPFFGMKNSKLNFLQATDDVTDYEAKKQEEADVVKKLMEMGEELKVSWALYFITFKNLLKLFSSKVSKRNFRN